MNLFPLIFTLAILPSPTGELHSCTMGMSYFLVPDKATACSNDFPDRLSTFFEQIGGFDDKAEVVQVSKLLKIDLSAFQDVEYNYESKAEIKKHWHELSAFTSVVDSFIAKIKAQPAYYKQVIHDPDYQKHLEESISIGRSGDTAKYSQWLKQAEQSYYYYPPDRGYLSEGRILKDLDQLHATLECYRAGGVSNIRLEYL